MPEIASAPANPELYARAYLSDPVFWWWSTNSYTVEECGTVLKRVLSLIDQARLPDHEQALAQLGVGPLESMMSESLLDILECWVPFKEPMRYALNSVRFETQPLAVQLRFETLMDRSR
ncbi:hypothetical protein QFZ34_000769 [Phyllobacterium ifriqiyense]|uniref:Uncharacterized protein n=1 Tax=Phyllobacterium ifriqiyense TaxID=314238 RepID=A0ABU0S4B5_9HYPH|nr:hypothetical protein [Phyllobacterium ifriqiyense]MDQ0995592.1 hypothetical protein [Phyllobacterium ifriqiyense]